MTQLDRCDHNWRIEEEYDDRGKHVIHYHCNICGSDRYEFRNLDGTR